MTDTDTAAATADARPTDHRLAIAQREALAHQIAIDTYRALPRRERNAVAAWLVTRLGSLWYGPANTTDLDTDTAATQPVYAPQLRAALTERGHLAAPADETTDPETTARSRTARRPPSPIRRLPNAQAWRHRTTTPQPAPAHVDPQPRPAQAPLQRPPDLRPDQIHPRPRL